MDSSPRNTHNVPPIAAESHAEPPLWRVPDVRSDCSWNLARLYREIVCRDYPDVGGCDDGNKALSKTLDCHPSSVRDWLVILKGLGLVEVELCHGNERLVRPLVPLADLFPKWPELANACKKTTRLSDAIRAIARRCSRRPAVASGRCAQAPLKPPVARNSAPPTPPTPRRSPDLSAASSVRQPHETPPVPKPAPVVVPSPTATTPAMDPPSPKATTPATDPELIAAVVALGIPALQAPRMIGQKPSTTVLQACRAVAGYLKRKPGNAARLLTVAIREGWTPSAPPSDAPSDHGGRPVRYIRAPRPDAPPTEPRPAAAPLDPAELARLPAAMRERLLALASGGGSAS